MSGRAKDLSERGARDSEAKAARATRAGAAKAGSGDRPGLLAATVVFVTVFVLCVVAWYVPPDMTPQFWGVSARKFLPGSPLADIGGLLAAIVGLWLIRRVVADPAAVPSRAPAWIPAVLFVAGTALCWFARIRHALLGDANSLQKNLSLGERFHPDSPLALMLHHQAWLAFGSLFKGDPVARAFQSVALESAIAGGLFAVVAWMLAGELARGAGAKAVREADHADLKVRWSVFAVLIAGGYTQLFFGYVENYTMQALALAAFLWLALRCLAGRGALLWPGLALLIACAFHLSSTAFVLAFALLAAFTARGRMREHLRDLAILAVALLAMQLLLARAGNGYNFVMHPLAMARTAGSGELQQGSAALWSYEHLRDFFNCQMLIGPLGLLLTLCGIGAGIGAWRRRDASGAWLFATALLALAVSFSVRDLRLGYPRDWDLFAPFGVATAVFGAWFLLREAEGRSPRAAVPALLVAFMAGMYMTVLWISINTSWDESFARFKTLPLRTGQREMLVGYWYGERGDRAAAHEWLDRATTLDHNNTAAFLAKGYLYMAESRPGDAAVNFYVATWLRPSWWQYRLRLVDALMQTGEYRAAAEEAKPLLTKMPDRARAQAVLGMTLWAAHAGGDSAQALLRSAAALDPSDAAYSGALLRVAAGDTAVRAMLGAQVWAWMVRE